MSETRTLVITRSLPEAQTRVIVQCREGTIFVMTDPDRGLSSLYEAALLGKTAPGLEVQFQGRLLQQAERRLAGFQDQLPSDRRIREYLIDSGLDGAEAERRMREYDLDGQTYYSCAQLSATAQRQLVLASAMAGMHPVLILSDPFLPFSGRWREAFAEALLRDVSEKKRIAIVFNLNFWPKAWTAAAHVQSIDLHSITEETLKKAIAAQRAKDEAKAKSEVKAAEQKAPQSATVKTSNELAGEDPRGKYYKAPIAMLPEHAFRAYKVTSDFIFEPLACLSRTMRSFSGVLAVAGVGLLVGLMAFMLLPGMGGARAGLYSFATSWRDGSGEPFQFPADRPPVRSVGQRDSGSPRDGEGSKEEVAALDTRPGMAQIEEPEVAVSDEQPQEAAETEIKERELPPEMTAETGEIQEVRIQEVGQEMQLPETALACLPGQEESPPGDAWCDEHQHLFLDEILP